ncbi:MAG: Stp1/IreP family PP2C-type Ser/Thr phosphatase [Sulfuricaulis sp.]|nr:Stp1/IreP family PP2C-type Ser/Thr phosphatase [Sulfuricaulis sp.]
MSELLIFGLTDAGRMRDQNEDQIAMAPEAGLAIVADGMGGHRAGEVASRLAVETIRRHIVDTLTDTMATNNGDIEVSAVRDAIQQANKAIYDHAHANPDYAGMGSTIVVALFYGEKLCVGHVGDSRLYRYRDTILEQITQDHSVVQELISRGLVTAEEARLSISKNLVTRALGIDPTVEADINKHDVYDDDVYLLCSDGINDVLADGDIEMMLTEHGRNIETAVKAMVNTTNDRGGPDNISAVLVRVRGGFERNPEALQKLREQI